MIAMIGLVALAAAGCSGRSSSDGTLPISGTVTLDGKPAALTIITFWSTQEGAEAAGVDRTTSDDSGKFTLGEEGNEKQKGVGLAPGEYKVTLSRTVDRSGKPVIEGGKATEPVTATETFPDGYQDKSATPLVIEVSPDKTTFTFDIKKS
jgi:hypothetical protein